MKIKFKKKETDKEIADRLFNLTDKKDYGLCSPSMDAQTALNELSRYFLGEDWYSALSQTTEQVNTEIVYEIEKTYKSKIKRYED